MTTDVITATKRCNDCGLTKPFADYSRDNRGGPDRISGYQARCKECYAAWVKAHRRDHPEPSRQAARKWRFEKRYGVTVRQYDEMVMAQCGTCAVCGQYETEVRRGEIQRLSVHHDHDTGRVIALLCAPCNRGMGQLKDSSVLLSRAAELMQEVSHV